MIQTWGSGKDRDAMVPLITAQEGHEVADPVRQLEAQYIDEELSRFFMARRMQHDMTDFLWNALTTFEHPCGACRDVARDLERQSVTGKESEPVPAAESVQLPGREDDLATGVLHFRVELVNVGRSLRGEADYFHTF